MVVAERHRFGSLAAHRNHYSIFKPPLPSHSTPGSPADYKVPIPSIMHSSTIFLYEPYLPLMTYVSIDYAINSQWFQVTMDILP